MEAHGQHSAMERHYTAFQAVIFQDFPSDHTEATINRRMRRIPYFTDGHIIFEQRRPATLLTRLVCRKIDAHYHVLVIVRAPIETSVVSRCFRKFPWFTVNAVYDVNLWMEYFGLQADNPVPVSRHSIGTQTEEVPIQERQEELPNELLDSILESISGAETWQTARSNIERSCLESFDAHRNTVDAFLRSLYVRGPNVLMRLFRERGLTVPAWYITNFILP